jgi:hypothetical protein
MATTLLLCKERLIYLQTALQIIDITKLFHLPLSEEAMVQLDLFRTMLHSLSPGDGYDL